MPEPVDPAVATRTTPTTPPAPPPPPPAGEDLDLELALLRAIFDGPLFS